MFPQTYFDQNDTFVKEGYGVLLYNMRGGIDMRKGLLLYDIESDK